MKVRQHIPSFFDGFEPDQAEVNSLRELAELEFIKRWERMPGFERFSVASDCGRNLLMAELASAHWVVAYLEGNPLPVSTLPKWQGPK